MMGIDQPQEELFDYHVNLAKRVRSDHPLRRIDEIIDFKFVRDKVEKYYGYNGNVSVDPVVIMKMMFLLFYDDISSERELMGIIGERLDYMWFLGYGLNDKIPDHSVLSKARARWGAEVFEELFIRIVWQCAEAGLIDGSKIHMDGSLVDADASKNSIIKGPPELIAELKEIYRKEEEKLEEKQPSRTRWPYYKPVNKGMFSKTDPDAPIVRHNGGDSRPRYKNHRVVDDANGVITAVETTPGDVGENAKLIDLVDQHERNTKVKVDTVVADCQYGTTDNFRECFKRGIRSHMGDFRAPQENKGSKADIFSEEDFIYEAETDTYRCPAGETLKRGKYMPDRKAYQFMASRRACRSCPLRQKCTRSKVGARTLKRHENHEMILAAREQSHSEQAKKDRRKRKWLMEGSFADAANNHGFKLSRWRRLKNQQIQDYLIASIQNIRILINNTGRGPKAAGTEAVAELLNRIASFLSRFFGFRRIYSILGTCF
jgi:transposase